MNPNEKCDHGIGNDDHAHQEIYLSKARVVLGMPLTTQSMSVKSAGQTLLGCL